MPSGIILEVTIMENFTQKLSGLLGSDAVKEKIDEIVAKIKGSDNLLEQFKEDPEKTIESLTGIDIPDEIADKVISGVKAALSGDKLSGLLDKAKDLLTGGDE